jgi:hypothetical protein
MKYYYEVNSSNEAIGGVFTIPADQTPPDNWVEDANHEATIGATYDPSEGWKLPDPPDMPLEEIRELRDELLQRSDFRVLPDYQGSDLEEWKVWRQVLRDMPANASSINPNQPVPTRPGHEPLEGTERS